jgi:putative ubiquitin-RnfH superfamily antitoxin RatB of RatAB toxin-antitoxin module
MEAIRSNRKKEGKMSLWLLKPLILLPKTGRRKKASAQATQ